MLQATNHIDLYDIEAPNWIAELWGIFLENTYGPLCVNSKILHVSKLRKQNDY